MSAAFNERSRRGRNITTDLLYDLLQEVGYLKEVPPPATDAGAIEYEEAMAALEIMEGS